MSVETNSHNYTNMNSIFSQFVAAEFPKTPSPKPARIPPQTPPAGGTEAEAGRIHIPSQMFRPAESALVFRVLRKMGSDFFKQTPPNLICRRSCLGASPLGIGFR